MTDSFLEEVESQAAAERARAFDRARRIVSYHVYRLHRRAKRYSVSPKDEQKCLQVLKTLGYLMQVEVGAQKAAFEHELEWVEALRNNYERILSDYRRLKRLEAERTSAAQPKPLSGGVRE